MRAQTRIVAATGILCVGSLVVSAVPAAGSDAVEPPSQFEVRKALASDAPNILIINTDDQRSTETLAVMPRVRSFFQEGGTTFSNGLVTTPLCCPSRSSFFSGRYSHNTGITGNGLTSLVAAFNQDATIQGYLQDAGYNTAMVGKYLNTYPLMQNPLNWDKWATTTGGYYNVPFNINGTYLKTSGYYNQYMTQYAKSFLQGFETSDDQPWLMYIAPQAPHSDYEPSPKYANAAVPEPVKPPSWNEADLSDKPPWIRWWQPVPESEYTNVRAKMLRTLMSVDDMAGAVIRQMKTLGEARDTLAIYMSDNGYLWAEHRLQAKRFPYVESTEVPYLVRWPDHFATNVESSRLVTQIDLLPTLLDAAGVTPSLTYELDGQSILSAPPRDEAYQEYFKSVDSGLGPWASLRGEDWQYVEWYDVNTGAITAREYYDLASDPYQLTNLLGDGVATNDPAVRPLHRRLKEARTCVGSICP